jgi:hypothetical protein
MNKKIMIGIVSGILVSNLWTAWFFNAYYLQIPWVISFRPLVVPRKPQTPLKSPKTAKKQAILPTPTVNPEFELAYDTVWFNESNRGNDKSGLHGDCIKLGMINEIGYAPGQGICFKDRQDQKETFMLWLKNRLNHVKMPYCNTVRDCINYYTNNTYTI